jgi:hypothetical protein
MTDATLRSTEAELRRTLRSGEPRPRGVAIHRDDHRRRSERSLPVVVLDPA